MYRVPITWIALWMAFEFAVTGPSGEKICAGPHEFS